MASYMITVLGLLREIPEMTRDLDQWRPGDGPIFAKRKTIIDERSPERLYAAFSVLHAILSESSGERADADKEQERTPARRQP